MSWYNRLFVVDMAIDLGTSYTLIYVKDEGIVCCEPSVVAMQDEGHGIRRPCAVGSEAKEMIGRTPDSVIAVKPVKNGVIADFEVTEAMLRRLISKAIKNRAFAKPRVIVCVPHGVTEVEKRSVRESVQSAGAREVYLIEEPMAAAIGAGLPITEPSGNMIVDIGGGTTEVAVISLAGIVYSRSIRQGGEKMDEAIIQHIKKRYNLLIGEPTAENIKRNIGSATPLKEQLTYEIRGRDVLAGVPRSIEVTSDEICEALSEPVQNIVELVTTALERTPPELAADIVDRGIVLTGGGALLKNMDNRLRDETKLPVMISDDPVNAVVMGCGMALEQLDLLRDVAIS